LSLKKKYADFYKTLVLHYINTYRYAAACSSVTSVNIFDKLNGLNSSLHGPNATVFQPFYKMSEYLEESDCAFEKIKPHVLIYLTNLENNLNNRFPQLTLQQH
jgi:hypothetical protein